MDQAPGQGAGQEKEKLFTGQLRRDIQLFTGQPDENGMPTWVLFDPVTDKYFRISEREHLMISLLYENKPVNDFYDKSISLGSTIDRDGVFNVIAFLMNNNLMMPVYGSTYKRLRDQKEEKQGRYFMHLMHSYLFMKFPLFSPDAFLAKTAPFIFSLFNKWTLMILALVSLFGYISVVANWSRLLEAVVQSFSISGAAKYSIAIVVMKVLHELSHAYVAKAMGIRVRRFGVGIMFFFPRLYTDITDSWRITNRKSKAAIDGAGIAFELLIGGFAALFWLNSPPSVLSTICYYVFAVTAANTLLINGNPFVKYDGYYFLMDLVNIDNLQHKSFQAVNQLFLRIFFGIRLSRHPILMNPMKNAFLTFFGIASFFYRIFLYTSIIMLIYFKFTKALGIVLALIEIYIIIARPLLLQLGTIMSYKSKIKTFNLVSTAVVVCALLAVLFAPMPWLVSFPCEVRSDKEHIIYAPFDGFLAKIDAPEGTKIQVGDKVATLESPEMLLDRKAKEAELRMAQAEYDQLSASSETLPKAGPILRRIELLKNDIAELDRRLKRFDIRSSVSGEIIYNDPNLMPPKRFKKGEPFGVVFNPEFAAIVAFAKEKEVGKLNPGDKVYISLNGEINEIPGKLRSVSKVPEQSPAPSPLLSIYGGPIQVKKTQDGPVYEESLYQLVVEPEERSALKEGRTGTVSLRRPQSIAMTLFDVTQIWLKRILSF